MERFWQHNTHTFASSFASSCVQQLSKQLLNACPIPPVHVIITLLAGCQSAILSSNEWHNDMNPAFISTIMAPNFKIKEIGYEQVHTHPKTSADVPGAKGHIHIMLPNISTATVHQWGTGHKRCPARARRTNVPPMRWGCNVDCEPMRSLNIDHEHKVLGDLKCKRGAETDLKHDRDRETNVWRCELVVIVAWLEH